MSTLSAFAKSAWLSLTLTVASACCSPAISQETTALDAQLDGIVTGTLKEHVLPLQTPLPYTSRDVKGDRATIFSNVGFTLYEATTTGGEKYILFSLKFDTYLASHSGEDALWFTLIGKNGERFENGPIYVRVNRERDSCQRHRHYEWDALLLFPNNSQDKKDPIPADFFDKIAGYTIHGGRPRRVGSC